MASVRTHAVKVSFTFEDVTPGGTVGLLALSTDANIEDNLRRLLPSDVGLYTTRIMNSDLITLETLRATAGQITAAARTILPDREVDVMVYGCTSGAIVLGHEEVALRLRAAKPRAACVTPAAAAEAALRHLRVRRLSILTPYVTQLNEMIAEHFTRAGFEISTIAGFELRRDIDMNRLPPLAIIEAASQVCDPATDALFIPCTSMRTTTVIDEIESIIGRPVVTSNQALVWRLAGLLGFPLPAEGLGRLARADRAAPGQHG
jgi:maleate isomerase